MTKILALDHKTDKLTAELNNLGEKLFWLDEHNQKKAGAHSFTFTMPSGIKEAKAFGKRSRFLIPLEDNGFQEFIVFKSTTFNKKKEIKGTAAYSEMETDYIVEPGTYTGKVDELANLVLPYTDYELGVFEDIRIQTIYVEEHIGAYSFLTKIASAFDLEMHFRCEVAGTRFTGRYLDYVKKVGADLKKEVVYGVDLIDMKMTIHDDRIATALIGLGPEREDGTRLTSYVENEDAFQRWNRKGRHITRIYRPDSDRQDMSQAELDQYTETELTKRIASVVEYEITAASLEREFPHAKIRYGSTLRVKNPIFNPPLYADARVIGVRRSIADPSKKIYVIGEVKTYTEDEIYKTLRQLQAQYNMRVIRSTERPPGSPNKIWVEIFLDAAGEPTGMEVPHVWSTQLNDWVKIAPTTAAEIGAETPAGAQDKADAAETAAKDHAEQKDTEQAQIINQKINQTRIDLETDLAAKAGMTYVDGKFSLIDSDLSAMLGDINLITGDVSGITSRIDGLQQTATDLQTQVGLNEEALLAGSGRMTTIETDVNELEGTMSTTITELTNLEGKVTNQQTQINANAEAITLKASQVSLDTLTGEVSDINAELSVQAGQIALKAQQSALTTVDGKVTGLQSDVASLVVDVEGVTTSVSSLRTDFDGLEIGGRNLLEDSLSMNRGWDTHPNGSYNYFLRADMSTVRSKVKIGEQITISFDVEMEFGTYLTVYDTNGNTDVRFGAQSFNDIGSGKQRLSFTKSLIAGTGTPTSIWRLDFYNGNNGDKFSVSNIKIEKGNKATDWTPAPEDIDLSINNVQQYASTVEQKADSIISNVTALTQTVDGHTTSISNTQSNISQLSDSISLKAEQTQVDSIAGEVSSVKSDVSSLSVSVNGISTNVSSMRSDIADIGRWSKIYSVRTANPLNLTERDGRALNDEYTYQVTARTLGTGTDSTTIAVFKSNKAGSAGTGWTLEVLYVLGGAGSNRPEFFIDSNGIPSIRLYGHTSYYSVEVTHERTRGRTIASEVISGRVSTAETAITQLSDSIKLKATQTTVDSLAGRMSTAESEISLLPDKFSSKVSTTDYTGNKIASLINQTATTILVQASKINLVGAVRVLSEISGELGNITAGTISGVTFTSVSGKKSFTLSNGLAEFMEDRSLAGVTLGTRTAINEDGVKIENTYYGVVEHMSNLTAQHLMLKGEDATFTEIAMDKIRLLAGSISEFNIYPNWSLTTIQSAGDMDIVAGGNKLSLYTSTLLYNGKPIAFSDSEILWSGGIYLQASQTVTPSRKLSDCPTGWILVWSRYVNGSPGDSDWNYSHIPKIQAGNGGGVWMPLVATGTNDINPPEAKKYAYFTNTTISGHDRNRTGTESGQVLRYVLAY